MASKDTDNASGEPEPVDAEFEAVEDEDAPTQPRPARRGPGWAAFVLTLIVTALIAAGVSWTLTRYLGPQLESEAGTDALEARIAQLEARDPAAGFDQQLSRVETRLTGRLDTLEAELAALRERVTALEERRAGEGLRGELPENLSERLAELETRTANALDLAREAREALSGITGQDLSDAANQALGTLRGEIETLRSRLAETENALSSQDDAFGSRLQSMRETLSQTQSRLSDIAGEANEALQLARRAEAGSGEQTQALRTLSARALGLAALTDAAARSEPFEAERAALARAWPGQSDLQALQSVARAGAPSVNALEERFPGEAIRAAAGGSRPFWGLVEVRPAGDGQGEGAAALAARAEARLDRGDLAGAVEAAGQLDGAAAEAAADWLRGARARLEIEQRIAGLRAALREAAAEGDVQ